MVYHLCKLCANDLQNGSICTALQRFHGVFKGDGEQGIYWRIGEEKGDRGDLWEGGKSFPASPFPGYPVHPVFSFPFSRSLSRGESARVLCHFHYFVQSLFPLINKFSVLTVFDILKNLL